MLQLIVSGWNHDGNPAEMLMAPSLVNSIWLESWRRSIRDVDGSQLSYLDLPLLQSIVSGWNHDGDLAEMLMAPSLVI